MTSDDPKYRKALSSGSLRSKVLAAREILRRCRICPRKCGADRLSGQTGFCETGRLARVASWGPHLGEESCLSGWHGSGTIFFTWCDLRCVFCQNYDISQSPAGREMEAEEIATLMLLLQERGCHNINLVTPGHVAAQALEALLIAAEKGLEIPLVYNTNGYDNLEILKLLEGIVDIYMPDFKVWEEETATRLLNAPDYPQAAREAIREMHRQVGSLRIGRDGLARQGLLIRHLVMPGLLVESHAIFRFLAEEVSPETYVNIMAQYHPANRAFRHPGIDRRITAVEMKEAYQAAISCGLHNFDR